LLIDLKLKLNNILPYLHLYYFYDPSILKFNNITDIEIIVNELIGTLNKIWNYEKCQSLH